MCRHNCFMVELDTRRRSLSSERPEGLARSPLATRARALPICADAAERYSPKSAPGTSVLAALLAAPVDAR